MRFISHSPRIFTTRQESIAILSSSLVAKRVPWPEDHRDELGALEHARALGIRVPRVRRVVHDEKKKTHILIMDRIRGPTLEQLWPSISFYTLAIVGFQLRRYIRAMRSDKSQSSGGVHTGRTRSEWIGAYFGPKHHATPTAFAGYLNWWLLHFRPNEGFPARPDLQLPVPKHHVLVHQDLVPRNMILDSQKNLWLIDWGHSGFYPEGMESISMSITMGLAMPWVCKNTWAGRWGRFKWGILRWLAGVGFSRYGSFLAAMNLIFQRSLSFRIDKAAYCQSKKL